MDDQSNQDEPGSAADAVLTKIELTVEVLTPSGTGINGAEVKVNWLHATQSSQTKLTEGTYTRGNRRDKPKGKATFSFPEPAGAPGALQGVVTVKKAHHGPIVSEKGRFLHRTKVIKILYLPGNDKTSSRFKVTDLAPPTGVRWGRPRITGSNENVLEVTLLEGGTLGKEHSNIRARRLSAVHRPRKKPPEKISEIYEELLFHIGRGDLALTKDIEIIHAQGCPDFDDCTPDCTLNLLPTTASSPAPVVPKISVRNKIAGGMRVLHVLKLRRTKGDQIINTVAMDGLNPRLVVGAVRLCKLMHANGMNVLLTVGIRRAGEKRYHGTGRALDFSGMLTVHPK